ncbi:hypothetical protein EDD11_001852 [Mortierella claussenii]|nr:hypothetical protein EDD11_001852 [Mortierella claussenii]
MNNLPAQFLRITSPKSQLVRRLERLRTSKSMRQAEGHVLVQGIKMLEELASKKHHHIRTIGITFDEHNLPIRSPALDIVSSVKRQEEQGQEQVKTDRRSIVDKREHNQAPADRRRFEADQYVAMSQKLTTRILGTDSLTSEHEVWAEVAIPNHEHLFATSVKSSRSGSTVPGKNSIRRLLVLDQISDPGNMGLIIRSAKALSWDAAWHTPGTVDQYNDKVVRASRALCLDWPTKTGGWEGLEEYLKQNNDLTLLVADMVPQWISNAGSSAARSAKQLNPSQLVWWNWPKSLPQNRVPDRIALMMSSEHHGVKASPKTHTGSAQDDFAAKERLLSSAIRVSIPMNPVVESMNVATAATAMMWELNRVLSEGQTDTATLQIFDRDSQK